MKRPFAVTGMSLAGSVAIASFLSAEAGIITALLLIVLAVSCFFVKKIPRTLPVCLLCCATGMFVYQGVLYFQYRPFDRYASKECTLHGQVISDAEPSYDNYRYIVAVDSVNNEKQSFRVRLTTDIDCLERYDEISFSATLKKPSAVKGLHAQPQNTLYARKIVFAVYAADEAISFEGKGKRPFTAIFSDTADYFKKRLSAVLENDAPLAQAIMLGDKTDLSDEQRETFAKIGVSHLFAVSGLHLSVLLGFFLFLGRKLLLRRRAVYSVGIVLVLLFMAVTGFSYSVCRAGIMAIIMLLGGILFKEADPFNSLGLSVIILMLIHPLCALDVGFQMSVCATMGLVTLGPRLLKPKSRFGVASFIANSLIITVCATVFLLPIYSAVFGKISVLTPIANLLLVTAGSAVLILSLIAVTLSCVPFIGTYLAFLPAWLCRLVIRYIELVRSLLGKIEWQSVGVTSVSARILITFVLLAVLLYLHKLLSGKTALVSCFVVLLTVLCCNRFFFDRLITVRMWGTNNAVCTVADAFGTQLLFEVEGFYAESLCDQFACEDNCFRIAEEASFSAHGWKTETIADAEGNTACLMLSNRHTRVLLVSQPDEAVSNALLNRNETYSYVFYRNGDNCATAFLTNEKVADTVFLCDYYGVSPETEQKLLLLGYRVINITDTAGVKLTLSENGSRVTVS